MNNLGIRARGTFRISAQHNEAEKSSAQIEARF